MRVPCRAPIKRQPVFMASVTDDEFSDAGTQIARATSPEMIGSATPPSTKALLLSAALSKAGRLADAETVLLRAIESDLENGDLHKARGLALVQMGRNLEALLCYRNAVECNPSDPGAWNNLGNALFRSKQLTSAIECQRQAIALAATNPLYRYNLGTSLAELQRHDEAIAEFTRALELNPGYHLARWNRARSYLVLGQYRAGWMDYEARIGGGLVPQKDIPGERWDGRPCAGRRLLVITEQGYGDTIWAARYLPHAKARCGELVMECPPQ